MCVQSLGLQISNQLKTLSVEEPAKRKAGVILSSAEELIDKLKNDAKVI